MGEWSTCAFDPQDCETSHEAIGVQSRSVKCVVQQPEGYTEIVVHEDKCPEDQPESTQKCVKQCPEVLCDGSWAEWSDCSSCVDGTRTRNYEITRYGEGCFDQEQEACEIPDCQYFWTVSEWSECDIDFLRCQGPGAPAILEGEMKRVARCMMSQPQKFQEIAKQVVVAEYFCEDAKLPRPAEESDCQAVCPGEESSEYASKLLVLSFWSFLSQFCF